MKIILGSKSAGRQLVLKEAGFDFEVVTADIDEKQIRDEDPKKLVIALAHAKADAILLKVLYPAIVITADQVVVCGDRILEKPENEAEARDFIRCYAQNPMETVSSVVVTNTVNGRRAEGVDISKVYFKTIPEEVIDAAIKGGVIMHCAGAMRCEDVLFSDYIERFEGTKDSTSGLPLKLLTRLMEEVQ
jgi:septum formation protein